MTSTTSTRTNNFGTDGDLHQVMTGLNARARAAFENWMVGGALDLGEGTFAVWVDNNVGRLLRSFERATR